MTEVPLRETASQSFAAEKTVENPGCGTATGHQGILISKTQLQKCGRSGHVLPE